MDYSKYYTPISIAQLLVKQLRICPPDKIVDICCGSCNLLNAAKKRWPRATLYGTDIVEHKDDNVVFEKIDGREYALNHPKEFSLVLANPPFDYLEKKNEYPELFQSPFEKISSSRLEIEMMLANLIMLKNGGVLLIIMPSSFVEGETYRPIREIIAKKYQVKSIIELDEDTFGATHIHSYALVIKNNMCQSYTTDILCTRKENNNFVLLSNGKRTKKDLIYGNWSSFQNATCSFKLDIKRGNISSSNFVESGFPILHTSKINIPWQPSIRYISNEIKPNIYAENGDIIVSRIGKSAGNWFLYTGEKIPVSDCLYRIKDPNGELYKKIQGKNFNLKLRGVATQYITMADFICWVASL